MSDCQSGASQREDPPSPAVSDEKMDTASESFPSSQHTPNTPSENEAADLPSTQSTNDHFEQAVEFTSNSGFATNVSKQNAFVTNGTKTFVTNNSKDNGFSRNLISDNGHMANGTRELFAANPIKETAVDNSYISNGATDNSFIPNGVKNNGPALNTGVLRLANPPDCVNDNDNFFHSDSFEESLTTETMTAYYEDTSKFSKSSTEVTKELDNAPKADKFQSNENIDNHTHNDRFNQSDNSGVLFCSRPDDSETEDINKPLRLGSNPPRLTSTLTLTDDHPLMGLSSPESPPSMGNYPDLILPSRRSVREECNNGSRSNTNDSNLLNSECSAVLSMSSTEEESFNRSLLNGELSLHSESFSNQDGPQRNTSKNNLYFSDNFTSSDGNRSIESGMSDEHKSYIVDGKLSVSKNTYGKQPDIVDSNKKNPTDKSSTEYERKKLKPDVKAPKVRTSVSPKVSAEVASGRVLGRDLPSAAANRTVSEQDPTNKKVNKLHFDVSTPLHDYTSQVADFPKSPSELRSSLSFELPVEAPSNFSQDDIVSPDSSSSQASRSLYQAEVDAVGGRVALRPRGSAPSQHARRRIRPLLMETDTESCAVPPQETSLSSASSLDSLSLYSEQDAIVQDPSHTVMYHPGRTDSDSEEHTQGGDAPERIPEYSLDEERRDSRSWLKVTLPAGEQRTIDMKVIEPYKRVLSHGGYAQSGGRDAIVIFSACFLPDSSRVDYNYVMDNLFLYVLTTLEQLVTDDYILIYLHGSAAKRSMPTFHWLKKCYQLIDRRLRKSLKHLYLVHPTFWLKSIMWMTRPFISWKFSRKLSYVHTLEELAALIPVEAAAIPERVRRFDAARS